MRFLDSETSAVAIAALTSLVKTKMHRVDPSLLFANLWESGAVIAGSALMQSIIGRRWKDIDVDIWLPQSSYRNDLSGVSKIAQVLGDGGYHLPNYGPVNGSLTQLRYRRLEKFVERIVTYRCENKNSIPVQIIVLRPNITIQDVVASFDIIAAQIYYDGSQMIQADDRALSQLKENVVSFSQIALDLQGPFEWVRTLNRVTKYFRRGFRILDDDEWSKVVASIRGHLDAFPNFAPGWIESVWTDNQRRRPKGTSLQLSVVKTSRNSVKFLFYTDTFRTEFVYITEGEDWIQDDDPAALYQMF